MDIFTQFFYGSPTPDKRQKGKNDYKSKVLQYCSIMDTIYDFPSQFASKILCNFYLFPLPCQKLS